MPPFGLLQSRILTNSEGAETVTATLVGNGSKATVTIADTPAPTISIVATDPAAAEYPNDAGVFKFIRTGSTTFDLTVNFTIGGTADENDDYSNLGGRSIIIRSGQLDETLWIYPQRDLDDSEPNETVVATITSGGVATISGTGTATVTIDDIDVGSVDVRVDSNHDNSITADDDSIEEASPAWLYVVADEPVNLDELGEYAEYFDPEEFAPSEHLIPASLSFSPKVGFDYTGMAISIEFDGILRAWSDDAKTTEIPSGTVYPFDSFGNCLLPSSITLEGASEGDGTFALQLVELGNPQDPLLADKAKIAAAANVRPEITVMSTVNIAASPIIDDTTRTLVQKTADIRALINANFASTGVTSPGFNPNMSAPPDEGIAIIEFSDVQVGQFMNGSLRGWSGIALAWKIEATAKKGFAIDMSKTKVWVLPWEITHSHDAITKVIVGWNGNTPIVVNTGDTPNQSNPVRVHERMHTDGINFGGFKNRVIEKFGYDPFVRTNPIPNGYLPLKVGYKAGASVEKIILNNLIDNYRFSSTINDPELTDGAAQGMTRIIIGAFLNRDFRSYGYFHGNVIQYNGEAHLVYATVPVAP